MRRIMLLCLLVLMGCGKKDDGGSSGVATDEHGFTKEESDYWRLALNRMAALNIGTLWADIDEPTRTAMLAGECSRVAGLLFCSREVNSRTEPDSVYVRFKVGVWVEVAPNGTIGVDDVEVAGEILTTEPL